MDPEPQPNWETSELERRLLEAARRDRVPDALGARMAQGLGVQAAAGAAASQSAAAAGSSLGAPLFAKVGLWGLLSVALLAAVTGWYRVQSAAPAPARVAERAPRATAPANASGASGSANVPAARAEAFTDDGALRAEIALLDRARKAQRAGASTRALHLLDEHQRRFAHARLAPEAAALRIDALVQLGSHEQAGSLARQFVAAYPSHPLSAHVAQWTAAGVPRARTAQAK